VVPMPKNTLLCSPQQSVLAGLSRRNQGNPTAHRRATEHKEKLVRQLRRAGRKNKQARRLANKLDRCSRRMPCWSGACPACGLAVRRHLTGEIRRFLRDHGSNREAMAISIVLPSSAVLIGELGRSTPANFARRLRYSFDRADVGWVVGCIDYSMNFHEADVYEPHWSVHLHGFTVTDNQQALRCRLVSAVKKCDATPRPVRVTPWDGSKKAIRYALKTSFRRRKGIDNARRFNPTNGTWRTCRATKTQRLLAAEKLELALHLDHIGWEGRLFMRHAQLRRSQAGPTIVLMSNHGNSD
jgi:hypothetical protein